MAQVDAMKPDWHPSATAVCICTIWVPSEGLEAKKGKKGRNKVECGDPERPLLDIRIS